MLRSSCPRVLPKQRWPQRLGGPPDFLECVVGQPRHPQSRLCPLSRGPRAMEVVVAHFRQGQGWHQGVFIVPTSRASRSPLFSCSPSDKRSIDNDIVDYGEAAEIWPNILPLIENYRNAFHGVARRNGRKSCSKLGSTPAQPFPCCTGRPHHWRRRGTGDEVRRVGGSVVNDKLMEAMFRRWCKALFRVRIQFFENTADPCCHSLWINLIG